ncbi:MAG: hypothetical protein IJL87_05635, partial [Clostridia bacterium]|nr:hypothetical protein [Clostridia bacterium]
EGCRVLKEETEQKLRAFGVSGADVEIIYSVSAEDRVITVQGARISLSKGQKHRKIQIEKYIKEQTGLDSWVYIEGESENEEF